MRTLGKLQKPRHLDDFGPENYTSRRCPAH